MATQNCINKKRAALKANLENYLLMPRWQWLLSFFVISLIFSFITGAFWETLAYENYRTPIEVWQIAAIRGIPFGFLAAVLMRPAMIFTLKLQLHILEQSKPNWNWCLQNDSGFLELTKIVLVSSFLVPLTEICLAWFIHPSLNILASVEVSYLVCLQYVLGFILGIALVALFSQTFKRAQLT